MRIFDIPDITTDGSYTLGAALTAVMLTANISLAWIVPMVLVAGALAGIVTGFIHTRLKVNALLAGILVMTALYSVNLATMGRSNIPLLDTANLLRLLDGSLAAIYAEPLLLLLCVGLLGVGLSFVLRTDFGLAMRATGSAEAMGRANGIHTDRMKIIGLGMANALIAFSGFLITQLQGFADINMGIGIVITGLGSVMIGETFAQWLGVRHIGGRIAFVVLGTVLFRFILSLVLMLGINPNWLRFATAALVLVFVALPNLKRR